MVDLLEAFTPATPHWKLRDLARELGWDIATTHRFLKALVDIGMRDADDELTYRIGPLPLQLAAVSTSAQPAWGNLVRRIAEIAELTRLTTQIGILAGDRVAIVASQESRGALKAAASLGERLPLHATAGGKAILAQLSDDEVGALLPERLPAYTEHTLVDRHDLVRQLADVRETGMARADSELAQGLYAVGVPLPAGTLGAAKAALVCAGLSRTFIPDQWDQAERTLADQAVALGAGPVATDLPAREATA
jgi:DNA-binding IclR family transcriptional regulator